MADSAAGATAARRKPLHELTVREAHSLMAAGALAPRDYLEALIERQSRWTVLNAYTQQDLAAAREMAARVDPGRSAIAGVAVAVKDNIDVAGYATTAGTPALREHRPQRNAAVVQAVIDAGAIVTGKVGLHEMAAGGTCANITFGQVRNPYDPRLVPGGSSGGSAAAVAARLVPASLGTDTAGSVRAPAAHCGCVGFRPTTGRYSRVGLVPGVIRRDTPGWLARSVADIELLDSFSGTPAAPAREVSLAGLRLGVPRAFFYEDLDPTLASVVESTLAALRGAGAELVEADVPEFAARLGQVFASLRRDLPNDLAVYIGESGAQVSPADVIHGIADPELKADLEATLELAGDGEDRSTEAAALTGLRRAYADYFAEHRLAALVIPTTPEPAYLVPADIAAGGTGPVSMIRNTHPGALAGIPGLSIPAGLTGAGLPVGMEIDGPAGADATVLKIGLALEAIIPPLPPPPIPG